MHRKIVEKIEPESVLCVGHEHEPTLLFLASIAISLKRIADLTQEEEIGDAWEDEEEEEEEP